MAKATKNKRRIMSGKNDLANYRKMSEPIPSTEEANEALKNFCRAVEEARKEFHIMDVHVIVKMNILRGDEEGTAMASAHYGNSLEGVTMCAWGLGQEQAELKSAVRDYSKAG